METESPVTAVPAIPVKPPKTRRTLFITQAVVALFLIGAAVIMYGLRATTENWFKVGLAPFGAFSLLFFLMFLFARLIEHFGGDSPFPVRTAAVAAAVVAGLSPFVFSLSETVASSVGKIEHLVFWYTLLGSVVLFLFFRTRNIWSMAALTAVAQGLVLQLVFK